MKLTKPNNPPEDNYYKIMRGNMYMTEDYISLP